MLCSALLMWPPQYNVAFYDALNYVKNRPNIALVCATQQPHDQSIVFVEGEAQRTSWIDLESMRMPPLSYGEVVQEVKRLELSLMARERPALIEIVSEYEKPHRLSYKLLKYIKTKLLNRENAELVFEKRIKIWLKQFQVVFQDMQSERAIRCAELAKGFASKGEQAISDRRRTLESAAGLARSVGRNARASGKALSRTEM